jgi:hypothetical protein
MKKIVIAGVLTGSALLSTIGCSSETPHPSSWQQSQQDYVSEFIPADNAKITAPIALGQTAEVQDSSGDAARVTVSDYQTQNSDIWGQNEVALVTIEGVSGEYDYNALYFEAETNDHFRLSTELIDDPALSTGTVLPGETYRGWIGFEPGPGQTIEKIHLNNTMMSRAAATWSVG